MPSSPGRSLAGNRMNGLISKIQRYSTKDGPGLRSTVFAMGCRLRCKWCANPELIRPDKTIFYHAERCIGCGACVAVSNGTIRLTDGGCVIDRAACANLEQCAEVCFYDAYEPVGITVSAKELAAKLLCDKAFYDQSGGGVTYSGGEAALQADFFLEATETLKVESIHIALDTSGHVPWDKLEPLVKAVDLVLYDIKTIDSEIHRRYTGADNLLVLNNAQNIAQMQKEMIIRLLMVPGVNDGEKDIEDRLRFIRDLGNVSRVDVLKYHRLGSGKYKRLGLNEPMGDTPVCSDESAGNIERKASDMGLNVTIGS